MEPFRTHTGIGVPLRRSNVDTDQIIPAVYLKRVTRTGFDDGLFASWRNDPSFVLNLSPFDKGSVAGPDLVPVRRARRGVGAHGLRLPRRYLVSIRRHFSRECGQGGATGGRSCSR